MQFIPKLQGICNLFSRVSTVASLWVHLLAINMYATRWIVFDGKALGGKGNDAMASRTTCMAFLA